jgi:uroporphyrinogen decarboxylase
VVGLFGGNLLELGQFMYRNDNFFMLMAGEPGRPPVRVMLHCCGSVRALLPDLIDAGLDAMNPVQISTSGIEAGGLKRDFGKDIVLWGGGCDTQTVLRSGTAQQVRDHVRRQVDVLAPGGFIFQQVHNVLAGVPPENIVAMFDAVRA